MVKVPGPRDICQAVLTAILPSGVLQQLFECLPQNHYRIGCQHRTDSLQPEKKRFSRKRKNMCFGPLFRLQEDRTARPNGHKVLFDGDGHHCCRQGGGQRTNTLSLCRGSRHAQKVIVRSSYRFGWRAPRFWMAKHGF